MDYFISTSSFTLYHVYYRLNCSSHLIQYSKKELMDYFISTSSFTLYHVYYRLNCSSHLIQYSII